MHLSVAKDWELDVSREAVVLVHTDASNRITASPPGPATERLLQDAPDCADNARLLLQKHGASLKQWAPTVYRNQLNNGAMYSFLAGRRRDGLRYSSRALRVNPIEPRFWATMLLGLVSGRLLARFKARRTGLQVPADHRSDTVVTEAVGISGEE